VSHKFVESQGKFSKIFSEEKRKKYLTFPAPCGKVLVMNNTNEEKVSAAEFYAEIYSGFTELTAQDVADYKAEIDREKNAKSI
jgi:hypothetical protein